MALSAGRQPPGEGLQWLGRIYFNSKWYREYVPSLQSRLVIDLDSSKNQLSLQLRSVTTKDTAVYYCARYTLRGIQCEPICIPPCWRQQDWAAGRVKNTRGR
ncbi:Putative V-set and immunoglobulin domain-containing protein 6 [Myotis brandtii]|nr:Putative V-set and immunoglobulin domain-containing protein 6 [Myotis brandtii]